MENFLDTILNPNLDLKKYADDFKKNKVVVIKDIFKESEIEKLYKWFSEDMPSNWWDVSSFPSKHHDTVNFVRNEPENEMEIKENYIHALESFSEGKFAYNFFRTKDNHYEDCTCHECEFRQWLVSDENLNLLNEVTGEKYTATDEVFAACYTIGDFLSPHVDSPNGTLGFVLHMTKDWLPEYGGLLHFMDDERKTVERIEVPEFNSLTLFYLPKNKGKWHFVSPVAPGTPEIRLTFTGWFK
jgi:SM-20-related protein